VCGGLLDRLPQGDGFTIFYKNTIINAINGNSTLFSKFFIAF